MAELSDPVTIGVIVGSHGVRGTVRVRPAGSGRHLRRDIEPVVAGTRRRISRVRETPKGFLVDLDGVDDRAATQALRGETLALERAELDDPEEDEVYVGDLVGLTAVDEDGETVGEVAETFDSGAHEVLVVRDAGGDAGGRAGGEDVLVPFTLEHVPALDLRSGRLTVRPPEED